MPVIVSFPDGDREVASQKLQAKSRARGANEIVVIETPVPDPDWHFFAVVGGWVAKRRP